MIQRYSSQIKWANISSIFFFFLFFMSRGKKANLKNERNNVFLSYSTIINVYKKQNKAGKEVAEVS